MPSLSSILLRKEKSLTLLQGFLGMVGLSLGDLRQRQQTGRYT